ncbi:MAG: acyl-CoA dehydrogenase family protein [Chloroflexota bacterium]|nr:acyl-CoA dehydrogenase family protein [Chloroflexota bacterium]
MTTQRESSTASVNANRTATPLTSSFTSAEKAERYDSGRFRGATGLNWYASDPSLQRALRYYMAPDDLAWAEPHLERWGALMGGPVSERAEETDRNPPRLVKYDRWGHDVSEVLIPESAQQTKRDVLANRFSSRAMVESARAAGVRTEIAGMAESYMLNQAEVGMACAIGTGTGMIQRLVAEFAPTDIRELVLGKFASGEWEGETAQMFTERTGGSDLGAMETTAVPDGDAYRLNGLKWFASNANGQVFVVLAKPVGAPDNVKGVCSFLVMRQRRDGSPNGVHIRQLKEKLGTRAVASCEIEFVDAEAFLMSGDSVDAEHAGGDGQGLARMMQMTNDARIGVALMGLGCARRALVESLCYARSRAAFGKTLIDHPLMRRKLAEMIVDVEAGLAMVLDGAGYANHQRQRHDRHRLRISPAVVKLKTARLGITMASDAIEIHGGNGYIETWPVARILRDAQVNTIWEGPDNILCLDVRRAIEREQADVPFLERLREAVENSGESPASSVVARRVEDLSAAIDAWKALDRVTAEARLFPLAQFMGDVYAGALLCEQAEWELQEFGDTRKGIVADLFVRRRLDDGSPLRGIDAPRDPALEHFDALVAGALVDPRER